ncbi:hypothetical protein N8G13_00440 [Mycoplasma zalophi]|uniref:hypothetical protein n=1 Tax=Mycoplasma zalophi TaxID=191287 RepID=UPI0021C6CA34|nr:hypothetical protein [Mycoplasma zalophi]MCU4116934.1 hypothetical protein [Mycoplasma zalophi]
MFAFAASWICVNSANAASFVSLSWIPLAFVLTSSNLSRNNNCAFNNASKSCKSVVPESYNAVVGSDSVLSVICPSVSLLDFASTYLASLSTFLFLYSSWYAFLAASYLALWASNWASFNFITAFWKLSMVAVLVSAIVFSLIAFS